MVGARAYHPPLNVCKLRRFGELYQSLTNYLILRRSLQQCWGIFANWPQLKVEKTVVCFTDVYWAIRRVNRGYFLAARRYEISLRVLKNIFEHEKINLVSSSGHVMFYLLYKHQAEMPNHFISIFYERRELLLPPQGFRPEVEIPSRHSSSLGVF